MKGIDFKPARETMPNKRNELDEGPSLDTLRKGKAIGGPCAGSKIQAPPLWNGIVFRGGAPLAGRYVWNHGIACWEWIS